METRARLRAWKEVLWKPAVGVVAGAYAALAALNFVKGEFLSQRQQEEWQLVRVVGRFLPNVPWYYLAIGGLMLLALIALEGAYRALARRAGQLRDLQGELDELAARRESEVVDLKAKILELEARQTQDVLPVLEENELLHPSLRDVPGRLETALWRLKNGGLVGPFCPRHREPLLYKFMGQPRPCADDSQLGTGGFFYCPRDEKNEEFKWGELGSKVRDLRGVVEERFRLRAAAYRRAEGRIAEPQKLRATLATHAAHASNVKIAFTDIRQQPAAETLLAIFTLAGWKGDVGNVPLEHFTHQYVSGTEVRGANKYLVESIAVALQRAGLVDVKAVTETTAILPDNPKWPYVQHSVRITLGHQD